MSWRMRSTECSTVISMSCWNSGLSRCFAALAIISESWATRFFRSCTTNADMRPDLAGTQQSGFWETTNGATAPSGGTVASVSVEVFDPAGTLNPGKVIPTLNRCAEYGKMHVRKGLLPFPELERF